MRRTTGSILISLLLAVPAASAATQSEGERQQRPFSRPTERVEARLAYIHTALKITDAQQMQWDAFAVKMRQLAAAREKAMQQWRDTMSRSSGKREHLELTVVERLEYWRRIYAEATARVNEILSVVKPLYEVLNAEQKQVADDLFARRDYGVMERGMPFGRE
ncbi:MAG TPA: Spy/CpxP family protein refolding chaperone [Burkholderiales bacterium]|nr:Spy/CpxP family protein refolding chaperone [Burkholderiales bacterium]